jgi:uncharacterized membrane protein
VFDPVVLLMAFLVGLVAYLMFIMPGLMPESVQFGVRLPPAHQEDPAVAAARRGYRRNVTGVAAAGLLLVLLLALLPSSARFELLSVLALFLLLGGGFASYLSARSQLMSAKQAGGWTRGVAQVAAAPLRGAEGARSTGAVLLWGVPMVLLWVLFLVLAILAYPTLPGSIPTHFSSSGTPDAYSAKSWGVVLLVPAIGGFLVALFLLLAAAVLRTRSEIDPAHAERDAARQAIFRGRMARILLVLGTGVEATVGMTSLPVLGLVVFGPLLLGLSFVPLLVGVILVVAVSVQSGQLGSRVALPEGPLPSEPVAANAPMARDDDRLWKAGAIYYNPHDSSILVAKRFGVGWTFNFAHPVTWVVLVGILVFPVVLVLFLG